MSAVGYQLVVDNLVETSGVESLEEAKRAAQPYIVKKAKVRIEGFAGTSASHFWRYDYSEKEWIEGGPAG